MLIHLMETVFLAIFLVDLRLINKIKKCNKKEFKISLRKLRWGPPSYICPLTCKINNLSSINDEINIDLIDLLKEVRKECNGEIEVKDPDLGGAKFNIYLN